MAKNALDIDEGRLREMIIEHNKGVTQKEAYKILQVVKDENKEKKLTKYQFFDEAKRVFTHKLHKGNPCCTYCFKYFHSRKQMKEHVAVIHEKKRKNQLCVKTVRVSLCQQKALNTTKACSILKPRRK